VKIDMHGFGKGEGDLARADMRAMSKEGPTYM